MASTLNCSRCSNALSGSIVAVKNRECIEKGHWVHRGCWPFDLQNSNPICDHCNIVGSEMTEGHILEVGQVEPASDAPHNMVDLTPSQGNLLS